MNATTVVIAFAMTLLILAVAAAMFIQSGLVSLFESLPL